MNVAEVIAALEKYPSGMPVTVADVRDNGDEQSEDIHINVRNGCLHISTLDWDWLLSRTTKPIGETT